MAQLIFDLPERCSDNFSDSLNYIFSVIHKVSELTQPTSIHFNFKKCRFIHPFILIALVSSENVWRTQNHIISFDLKECHAEVSSYLNIIHFPEGINRLNINENNLEQVFRSFTSKSYIPLIRFPARIENDETTIRDRILSRLDELLSTQLKLHGQYKESIYYMISELTQNIVHHSGCSEGLIMAQNFPTKNYADICIVDYGKGFLQTYIESQKYKVENHQQAMEFAITGKSTKDLPESRGYGLTTSRNMLTKGLKGKFFVWSGNALFTQNIKKEEIISVSESLNFQGCFIALRIPTLENKQFDFYNFIE